MAEFERGDIVVYVYPEAPQWHGTLALVAFCDDPVKVVSPDGTAYPVHILEFLSYPSSFPYTDCGPWTSKAWEKVGHIDLPD